ncbi:MAG: DotU family type IV/VI secretion system protein [Gemmataceae bacterium]
MTPALAQVVHPILLYGLELFRRLQRGENPSIEEEQARLVGMLAEQPVPEFNADRQGGFLGVRYALVCWLDELFILESPWASLWNENKLEARLFGTNERAFRFWEQAQLAASRPTPDALEVFFLAVLLGFSGDRAEEPALLNGWIASTRLQLQQKRETVWAAPPGLEPQTFVPLLRGRASLRTALMVSLLVILALIPAAVLLMLRQGG